MYYGVVTTPTRRIAEPDCGLGRMLHAARARVGIPVAALVRRVGISRSYWYVLLSGERRPTDPVIRALSTELGLDLGKLRAAAERDREPREEPDNGGTDSRETEPHDARSDGHTPADGGGGVAEPAQDSWIGYASGLERVGAGTSGHGPPGISR